MAAWLSVLAGIVLANLAYGRYAFRSKLMNTANSPLIPAQLVGAAVAIAVIFFFGHAILAALSHTRFGPHG